MYISSHLLKAFYVFTFNSFGKILIRKKINLSVFIDHFIQIQYSSFQIYLLTQCLYWINYFPNLLPKINRYFLGSSLIKMIEKSYFLKKKSKHFGKLI